MDILGVSSFHFRISESEMGRGRELLTGCRTMIESVSFKRQIDPANARLSNSYHVEDFGPTLGVKCLLARCPEAADNVGDRLEECEP